MSIDADAEQARQARALARQGVRVIVTHSHAEQAQTARADWQRLTPAERLAEA